MMRRATHGLLIYGVIFIGGIMAFVALLFLSSLLPQTTILEHFRQSIGIFEKEGNYPAIADQQESAVLDNHTEALMLMEAASMNTGDPASILSNPVYFQGTAVEHLREFYEGGGSLEEYYVRYWMGFRVPLRILLTFFHYADIRVILSFLLFGLMIACFFNINKNLNGVSAFLFVLSFLLVKPQVICNSLHFSCCFILAFIGILCLPAAIRKKREIPLMFVLGMLTMYFDFYTAPVVTIGYPLIYLLLLTTEKKPQYKKALLSIAAWLSGYGLTWIAKLSLATVFLPVNGFANGFSSFASRVGIEKNTATLQYYDIPTAFQALKRVIFPNNDAALFFLVCLSAAFAVLLYMVFTRKEKQTKAALFLSLLIPAVLVIAWYMIAAQPTVIHVYFQYRNVAVIWWAVFQYFALILWPNNRWIRSDDSKY